MAAARCGWCSTSSVAAMSRSGRSVSATTSNAARLTLKRASVWLTWSGSRTRVSAVDERTCGTAVNTLMSGCKRIGAAA